MLISYSNVACTKLQRTQPLQTISDACMHVDFRQVVSAFSLALSPFFFLRGFVALNTSELSIMKAAFFCDSNRCAFYTCACKSVLPLRFLVSCHSGQEGGRGSAPLPGGALMCDRTWRSLLAGRGSAFPFRRCCCCVKEGYSREIWREQYKEGAWVGVQL